MKPVDERADAVSHEIGRCAARGTEQSVLLESISAQSFTLTGEIFRDADADELTYRSHSIRGLVVNALGVLAELQYVAGRLAALAALRAAERAEEEVDEEGT